MTIDNTNDLNEFCTKYKIQLIGEYKNVKNTTPIYFKCSSCNVEVKKSYKFLTKNKDSEIVAGYTKFCNKCFRRMMY